MLTRSDVSRFFKEKRLPWVTKVFLSLDGVLEIAACSSFCFKQVFNLFLQENINTLNHSTPLSLTSKMTAWCNEIFWMIISTRLFSRQSRKHCCGNIVAETLCFLPMFPCLPTSGNIVAETKFASKEGKMFPNKLKWGFGGVVVRSLAFHL